MCSLSKGKVISVSVIEEWIKREQGRAIEFYKKKLNEDPNWKPTFTRSNIEVTKDENAEEIYTIKTYIE